MYMYISHWSRSKCTKLQELKNKTLCRVLPHTHVCATNTCVRLLCSGSPQRGHCIVHRLQSCLQLGVYYLEQFHFCYQSIPHCFFTHELSPMIRHYQGSQQSTTQHLHKLLHTYPSSHTHTTHPALPGHTWLTGFQCRHSSSQPHELPWIPAQQRQGGLISTAFSQ